MPDAFVLPLAPFLYALDEGKRRHVKAAWKHRKQKWEAPERYLWHDTMEGTTAECACAYWKNIFWNPSPYTDRFGGDVAGDQVRSTRHPRGHLLVEVDAEPSDRYVLLVGALQSWRVAGWKIAADAMHERYHRWPGDGREPRLDAECYAVPQEDLERDLSVLR